MLRRLLDIADHHHIDVRWRRLGDFTGGGACVWIEGAPTVVIDPGLPCDARAEVLAHELGHALDGVPLHADDRALLGQVVRARREREADRIASALVVEIDDLQRAADVVHDLGGHITAAELAAELDVPVRLAAIAVEQAFGHEVTRRRAAAWAETGA